MTTCECCRKAPADHRYGEHWLCEPCGAEVPKRLPPEQQAPYLTALPRGIHGTTLQWPIYTTRDWLEMLHADILGIAGKPK